MTIACFGDSIVQGGNLELGDTAFYIGDGLHPNSLGHRVIADRVAAAVAPRLGIALSSTAAL